MVSSVYTIISPSTRIAKYRPPDAAAVTAEESGGKI
jgi:hypothetical protein